jgi:hypothetical protein
LLGDDAAVQHLKLRFYRLLTRYHAHDSNYLEMARASQSIYHTPVVQADDAARNAVSDTSAMLCVRARSLTHPLAQRRR